MTKRKASESYLQKLRDPRWQKMRLKIMERDEFTCKICGDKKNTLHVHHRWYRRGADPWDYPETALVTLCAKCHERESQERKDLEQKIQGMLSGLFVSQLTDVAAILEAVTNDPIPWYALSSIRDEVARPDGIDDLHERAHQRWGESTITDEDRARALEIEFASIP